MVMMLDGSSVTAMACENKMVSYILSNLKVIHRLSRSCVKVIGGGLQLV